MKHQTQIADALRSQGRKFSQNKLIADLAGYDPVFVHGRAKMYDDLVLEDLLDLYPVRKKALPVAPAVVVEDVEVVLTDAAQLDRIEQHLLNILEWFEPRPVNQRAN